MVSNDGHDTSSTIAVVGVRGGCRRSERLQPWIHESLKLQTGGSSTPLDKLQGHTCSSVSRATLHPSATLLLPFPALPTGKPK